MAPLTLSVNLTGRTALVTGAGQGVGRELAGVLASAGARVWVNDLRDDRADLVAAEVRADGGHAQPAAFDVTDYAAVASGFSGLGHVDILVNNAGNAGAQGFGERTQFADSSPQEWEPFLRVNLYGVLHCTRMVLPGMIEHGWGRVINIVSDAGRVGDAGGAVYGAAKAAASGFTRSIALENGKYGITANNISLGTMRTPATEPLWGDPAASDYAKAILRNYVIRRPGRPQDCAVIAAVLASDHGAWITGQTIAVNGGYSFTL